MANTKRGHWVIVGAAVAAIVTAASIATAVSGGASGRSAASGLAPTAGPGTGTFGTTPTSAPRTTTGTGTSASPTKNAELAHMTWGLDYMDTLTYDTPAQLGTALDDAKQLGMDYVHVDFAWEDYQSFANHSPNFSKFDNVVAAANARGLKILATIGFPPPWARRDNCSDTAACPPADNAQLAKFVKQAVTRYSARGVHGWEVWNEPNLTSWAPLPDAADYTKLLVAVSTAIRAADPHAYILMGGLAATHPSDGSKFISPYDFITTVSKAGGMKAIDAISYHPYPDGDPATSATFQAISQSPTSIVAALNAVGARNMPIWITETGASVGSAISGPADRIKSDEAYQDQQAKREVEVLSSYSNVASIFWFSDQDVPAARMLFGLRRADGTHRPSFATLQQIIAGAKKSR